MTTAVTTMSPNKTARIAGLLYFILAALSAFGLVYVPSVILVPGDVVITANNIIENEGLFRLGIVSNLLVFTLNIFVAVFLYKLLRPIHKGMASLMVMLILMGVAITMLNELNQVAALLLAHGAGALTVFAIDQLQALMSFFLDLYQYGFVIAHVFFGLWLFPLGYLVFKSGFLPRFLGVLLIIAGFGYLIDFILFFLFPDVSVKVSEFTFIGEVLLIGWLLVRGVHVERNSHE